MAVRVTIEVAYAWLNINEGPSLRPLLREFYLQVLETRQRIVDAVANGEISNLTALAEQIGSKYQVLKASNEVFISQAFDKAASQLAVVIANQNVKELDALCQQMGSAGGSHLAPSTSGLILRLIGEIKAGAMQNAWQTIKLLENISLKLSDNMEAAETLVESGYASYHLGNYDNATRCFRQAIKKYNTPRHQIAMTEWMLGWVQWHVPGSRDQGFVALRNSIDKFEFLGEHAAFGREGVAWYRQRCQDMRDTLEGLIQSATSVLPQVPPAPPPAPVSPPPAETAAAQPAPLEGAVSLTLEPMAGATTIAQLAQTQDLLQVLGVVESIPAGGWGPTGFDPYRTNNRVDVPLVLINDIPHIIKGLRGAGTISLLASGQRYMVIKVTGDSMNRDGIDKGDYVLLRQQDDAQDNDIVAAEIVGKDEDKGTHATLKRFTRRNGEIILRPNSTNPKYEEFAMPNLNVGAYIRGVAYAVFKPLQDADPRKKPAARRASRNR
ncbi:MAG: S24 family peptidase [Chloroflexota bacterium]